MSGRLRGQDYGLAADGSNVIIFIDDRTFVRHCIVACLQTSYESISILSFSNVQELVEAEIEATRVAFVLYGIYHRRASDPDVGQGLSLLKQEFRSVPIILLQDGESADDILSALQQGARGYIPTNASLDVVVGATRVVMAGGTFVPATTLTDLMGANPVEATTPTGRFTNRQLDVLYRIRQGKTNETIARELRLSQSTAKAHIRNLMQRLKATNRTQLAFLTKDLFAAPYHPSAPLAISTVPNGGLGSAADASSQWMQTVRDRRRAMRDRRGAMPDRRGAMRDRRGGLGSDASASS